MVKLAPPTKITSFLLQFLGPSAKEGGRVCLFNQKHQDKGNPSTDQNDPIDPVPAKILKYEATDYRAYVNVS
jgi:hypothetical protein